MITKTLNEQFKKEGDDYFLIWPGGGAYYLLCMGMLISVLNIIYGHSH